MFPIDLKYKMPPEWTPHQRTFISWPVQDSMCYPQDYTAVCEGYAEIIGAIAEFEPVTVIVNPGATELAAGYLTRTNVDYLIIPHNDAWLRDNGPTFVVNARGEIAGVNWHFNAWGEKYTPWDLDEEVAPAILDRLAIKRFDASLVLEGGSIHVDGEGTMLTTEECLLNTNRNPQMSRSEIEDHLKNFLNVQKVIWLKRGLWGDETDGHVDNIACFASPGKVLLQVCDDPGDDNYLITRENLQILSEATDAQGRKLEIIKIPQPPSAYYNDQRLTLSYLNFYFVNGGIILPVFGGQAIEADQEAEQILTKLFPDRKVRTVNGMAIIREGGNVHCMTQQMPLGWT